MAEIKDNIKQNFRTALENNTGVVGQALRERREKELHEKEVSEQLTKIEQKSVRIKSDGRAIKKMELAFTQVSENLQLVNKWADAQVTTFEETTQSMAEQKERGAPTLVERKENINVKIPKPEDDKSIFDNILSMFSNLAGKIKGKFPKGVKGKNLKKGPKGKGGFLKKAGAFAVRNAGKIAAGAAVVGTVAAAKSGAFQSKDQQDEAAAEEAKKTEAPKPAGSAPPQNVDYSISPEAPEGAPKPKPQTVATPPATSPPPPPAPVQTPGYACTCPPPQQAAAAAPQTNVVSGTGIPITTGGGQQVQTGAPQERGRSGYQGMAPQPSPTAAPAPAAGGAPKPATSSPPVAGVATPMNTSPVAGSSQPATSGSTNLLEGAKPKDASVKMAGLNPEFEKRAARMANAFKEETGQKLQINDAMRDEADQRKLWDALIAANGGEAAVAARGNGNLLAGARAMGLTYKVSPPPSVNPAAKNPHIDGVAIDFQPQGIPGALNLLAGQKWEPAPNKQTPASKTPLNNPKESWLEKFGLSRPVPGENWHVQLAGTPPKADDGITPARGGATAAKDASSGAPITVNDPKTGRQVADNSKTVAQLKQEQSQPGTTTVIVRDTKETTDYQRRKQPQGGQLAAAVGA